MKFYGFLSSTMMLACVLNANASVVLSPAEFNEMQNHAGKERRIQLSIEYPTAHEPDLMGLPDNDPRVILRQQQLVDELMDLQRKRPQPGVYEKVQAIINHNAQENFIKLVLQHPTAHEPDLMGLPGNDPRVFERQQQLAKKLEDLEGARPHINLYADVINLLKNDGI